MLVNNLSNFLRSHNHLVDAFCDTSTGRNVFQPSQISDFKLDAISFLEIPEVRKAFYENIKWLNWADGCILVLPAGNSSHLEAGYSKGQGKFLIIFQEEFPPGKFDTMYYFADLITDSHTAISFFLSQLT